MTDAELESLLARIEAVRAPSLEARVRELHAIIERIVEPEREARDRALVAALEERVRALVAEITAQRGSSAGRDDSELAAAAVDAREKGAALAAERAAAEVTERQLPYILKQIRELVNTAYPERDVAEIAEACVPEVRKQLRGVYRDFLLPKILAQIP